jgi:hypothetical protein
LVLLVSLCCAWPSARRYDERRRERRVLRIRCGIGNQGFVIITTNQYYDTVLFKTNAYGVVSGYNAHLRWDGRK